MHGTKKPTMYWFKAMWWSTRLADCLEQEKRFPIQITGERVLVPADAVFNIEHERGKTMEEVEFQFKWTLP